MRAWVMTDGKAGMENQALGLAEALGCSITVKRIALRSPWKQCSPYLRLGLQLSLSSKGDLISPPWPDLIIATGRSSIPPALHIKKASDNQTRVIYIQDPVISAKLFDVVITPQHDHLKGDNVIQTYGAMHRITEKVTETNKEKFKYFASLPSPRFAVMIGGSNGSYRLDTSTIAALVKQIKDLQCKYQGSLLITPSRRTGEENIKILEDTLSDQENVYMWNFKGENPYFALLGWSDVIFVTCESVSMISEACSTDKPVYLVPLPGYNEKFSSFHQRLQAISRVQWFTKEITIDFSKTMPRNEMPEVVKQVRSMLSLA